MNKDKLAQALRAGLEAAQELLAIKREALGDDYTKTRGYWEAERELSAALAAHEAEKQAPQEATEQDRAIYKAISGNYMRDAGLAEKQAGPSADRQMLLSIMQELDGSVWNCERCGHAEDTKTMDVAEMLRRYLAGEKQAGPVAGWKPVPVEPTQEMVSAAINEADRQETHWRYDGKAFWSAMLAAAPPSESDKEDAEQKAWTDDQMIDFAWMVLNGAKIDQGPSITERLETFREVQAARAKKEQP